MDMSLSKLQEIVKDRKTWCSAAHVVTKNWTQLSDWTPTTWFWFAFPWWLVLLSIFSYICWSFVDLREIIYWSPLPIFLIDFFFLLSSMRQIRYQINLWNKWFPNIFSNSVCCLFILLNHFWLCEVAGCVSWQCDTGCGGLVTKSCPTLCNPVDCNPSGSSVHGIFQARILEWVLISFSRGSSSPTYRT